MRKLVYIAIYLTIILYSCASKPKSLKLCGYKSEGLMTTHLYFYQGGDLKIKESTFLDDLELEGQYTLTDSIFTISKIDGSSWVKAERLLLKHDSLSSYTLYQLDRHNRIDSSLFHFDVSFTEDYR